MITEIAEETITQTIFKNKMIPYGPDGKYTFIDSFCGMGGVTEGFVENPKILVTHAINHSPKAIKCYHKNNPNVVCFEEDFASMNEKLLPQKLNFFWMSAECTHHSIASGGNSRDPKSRSLPEHLERYVLWCNPDYIMVENVKEFLSWGPVEEKIVDGKVVMKYSKKEGKMMPVLHPVKNLKATLYNKWVKSITDLGYDYEYRLLNSADFGAATSRTRYFGLFVKKGLKWFFQILHILNIQKEPV
jgi:DNA (cytosine-5)-methyltransferase 1